ncbi:IS110 family transposase [Maribacter halichondriae]|uniref:IS110 family transposase n=1 Tax=Maribacter halichondriae TaxID=2980554 RepID=UPI00235983EF|nr:transposase [Maribacter sp. Hal144]
MKIRFFIGIDISARTLDFCIMVDGKAIEYHCIGNTKKELKKLFRKFVSNGMTQHNSWICAEHTGSYGYRLRLFLEETGYRYSMVPAIEVKKSTALSRGKNDKVDSKRIAEYAFRFQDKLKESRLPEKYLIRLKNLFKYRQQRVRNSTRLKNQIKQLETQWECGPRDYMLVNAKMEQEQCGKVIKEVDRQIRELINSVEKAKRNHELVRSVLGDGPMTACYLLICTDNFELFDDTRKFASFAGLAPFENRSGSSIKGRTRTSKLRDRQIKALLKRGQFGNLGKK